MKKPSVSLQKPRRRSHSPSALSGGETPVAAPDSTPPSGIRTGKQSVRIRVWGQRKKAPAKIVSGYQLRELRRFKAFRDYNLDVVRADLPKDFSGDPGLGIADVRTELKLEKIVGRLQRWAGSEAQARAWLHSEPIPAFGGLTGETVVRSGKAQALEKFIDGLEDGGFA